MTRRILVVVVAALLVAGAAQAQPAPWEPERLTAGWTFTPSMVVGALNDSNVTLRNEGAPRLREWVALINPRGELDFNGRRTRFNAGYSGALEAYQHFTELNRYEQRARLEVRQDLSSRVSIRSRAGYSVSPTTDRLEVDGLPFVDVGSRTFDASAGVEGRLSVRTSLAANYGFRVIEFDREDSEGPLKILTSGHAHTPGARLSYVVSSRISVDGIWDYTHANISGDRGTFDAQHAVGQLSYRVSEATTVSGGAGAAYLVVSEADVSTWGPAVRGGIQHQTSRATFSARYDRSYVPSFGFGGLASNQRVSGSVRAPFGNGRSYVSGSLSYSRSEPVQELGIGFAARSLWTNAAVGYQVASWLRAEGFVTAMHQTTDVQGEIDRVRVGFQFVTSKPMRIQ